MGKRYMVMASILFFAVVSCKGTKAARTSSVTKAESPKETKQSNNQNTPNERVPTREKVEMTSGSTGAANNSQTSSQGNRQDSMKKSATANVVAQSNGSTGAADNMQMATSDAKTNSAKKIEKLYGHLHMTNDQISRFRKAMEDFQKMQVNKPNGEMMGSIEDEQNRLMKDILSEEQFKKYQQWKVDNN